MIAGFRRMLIVTAVEAERDAVADGLRQAGGRTGATVIVGGVGTAATAATVARHLARAEAAGEPYDAVLSVGIGGGFADRVQVGGLVIATAAVAADLGAASPDGFLSVAELGFGTTSRPANPALLKHLAVSLPGATLGEILTVNTVTGTADGAAALRARHPDAVAEAMEGFGAATAAVQAAVAPAGTAKIDTAPIGTAQVGTAFGELRAVSNVIGPRDRATWRIPAALGALTAAFAVLATVGP